MRQKKGKNVLPLSGSLKAENDRYFLREIAGSRRGRPLPEAARADLERALQPETVDWFMMREINVHTTQLTNSTQEYHVPLTKYLLRVD